ncbi:MAG: AAA family ATPase [Candidatus Lokiarchaeota archaeon]|nr:AAA family ATPase [Candidatus Lokiarchaeota archaeon]
MELIGENIIINYQDFLIDFFDNNFNTFWAVKIKNNKPEIIYKDTYNLKDIEYMYNKRTNKLLRHIFNLQDLRGKNITIKCSRLFDFINKGSKTINKYLENKKQEITELKKELESREINEYKFLVNKDIIIIPFYFTYKNKKDIQGKALTILRTLFTQFSNYVSKILDIQEIETIASIDLNNNKLTIKTIMSQDLLEEFLLLSNIIPLHYFYNYVDKIKKSCNLKNQEIRHKTVYNYKDNEYKIIFYLLENNKDNNLQLEFSFQLDIFSKGFKNVKESITKDNFFLFDLTKDSKELFTQQDYVLKHTKANISILLEADIIEFYSKIFNLEKLIEYIIKGINFYNRNTNKQLSTKKLYIYNNEDVNTVKETLDKIKDNNYFFSIKYLNKYTTDTEKIIDAIGGHKYLSIILDKNADKILKEDLIEKHSTFCDECYGLLKSRFLNINNVKRIEDNYTRTDEVSDYIKYYEEVFSQSKVCLACENILKKEETIIKRYFKDKKLGLRIMFDNEDLRVPRIPIKDMTKFIITLNTINGYIGNKKNKNPKKVSGVNIDNLWDGIGGLHDIKKQIKNNIVLPLRYPDIYKSHGVRMPKGILLKGKPGTGKTLMVKKLAKSLNINIKIINVSQLKSKYYGQTEQNISNMFKDARENTPCIILIDELDQLATKRDLKSHSIDDKIINQLLTEIDGIKPLKKVIIIGTTNRVDIIDPALLRPGRFDFIWDFPMPDTEARKEIFKIHLKDKMIDKKNIDYDYLADNSCTDGFSGADIELLCNMAASKCTSHYIKTKKFEFITTNLIVNLIDDFREKNIKVKRSIYS